MTNGNINVTQNVGEVKEGGTVISVQVVYQGELILIPSPEAIEFHRAALVEKEEYHRWANEFYIQEEAKILPLYASPYEDDTNRQREDLLQTIRTHQRLLVLGEPGMGKTVAMERMVWETALAAEIVVPIFVPLLYFQGPDLVEMVRVALHETGRLAFENTKSVRAFLSETKCLLLLDGLNEVPGRQREQVIGAIASFMSEFPEHRYVVTSRSRDELWRKLRMGDLIHDAVVVQNISDAQAQGYLEAHLGKQSGQALYNQLDDSLKALARTPLLLKLIKDACQGSDRLPRNRGELFDKFVMNRLLERETKLDLVEMPEVKKKALAHIAFALQLDHQLACDRDQAEKILAQKGFVNKADTLLKEAMLHGLLLQQNLPDKQRLRFMHQSVQEYFVALTLHSEARTEKNANFLQNASRQLSRRHLNAWAKDDWWNESFVQLAGLAEDADWLARRIANVSPWLAWWCVEEGRAVQENTQNFIERRSIKLLQSNRTAERRRAVQTLAKIKNERVMEPLLLAAGDENRDVSNLAIQALVELGDSVHALITQKFGSKDFIGRRGALLYLAYQAEESFCVNLISEMLGQPMIGVSPGSFLMGSDKRKVPNAYDDELPQHSVTLPVYWIGRYPVTVAQWRSFVKQSGYETDEKSLQDPDDHPVRYVSWKDAMAYCKWLSDKSGLPVTLPSEAEWEKAARGADGRVYPWGNNFDKDKCNTYGLRIEKTTPVGKYTPAGDSPYGCADMAGNVWEWTRSKYKPYPYDLIDGREDLEGDDNRVVRGGSWNFDQVSARASYRDLDRPSDRDVNLGFRAVVRPPSL
jgi:formylglycine-generating enzyme required for sulfatase activity